MAVETRSSNPSQKTLKANSLTSYIIFLPLLLAADPNVSADFIPDYICRWVKMGFIDTGELHKLKNIYGDKLDFIDGLRFKMYRKGHFNCNCNDYSNNIIVEIVAHIKSC